MKSLCSLLLLLVSGIGFVKAQTERHVEAINFRAVPDTVLTAFYRLVKKSESISWEHEHITQVAGPVYDFYNSSFEQDGNPGRASFDRAGKAMDFQVQVKRDTLPSVVKRVIEKEFKRIRQKYQQATLEICAIGGLIHEPTSYVISFYKSTQDRLVWARFNGIEVDSKGHVMKIGKNIHFK